MKEVREYVLKNYPTRFKKNRVIKDSKGKVTQRIVEIMEPIIVDNGYFWAVSNHKDSSPIILSKDIGSIDK